MKGAILRSERYALDVPEIAPPIELPPVSEPASDFGDFAFGDDPLLLDAPLGPPEPAVDLDAVRGQARALLDEAALGAETLLADAHERGRGLVEEAAARAEAVAEEARAKGHREGFAAGRAAAERDMDDMLGTMRGLLEMARIERHKLIAGAEPELVRLALGIAERVLHQQVALDRSVVVEMAKTAIARLIERDTVTVRVNPADLERMRERRDDLIAIGDIRNLRIVEDQRVGRGGVVVETEAGTIDARVGTQLDQVRKVLHIEDDVVVEPAPPAESYTAAPGLTARAS